MSETTDIFLSLFGNNRLNNWSLSEYNEFASLSFVDAASSISSKILMLAPVKTDLDLLVSESSRVLFYAFLLFIKFAFNCFNCDILLVSGYFSFNDPSLISNNLIFRFVNSWIRHVIIFLLTLISLSVYSFSKLTDWIASFLKSFYTSN